MIFSFAYAQQILAVLLALPLFSVQDPCLARSSESTFLISKGSGPENRRSLGRRDCSCSMLQTKTSAGLCGPMLCSAALGRKASCGFCSSSLDSHQNVNDDGLLSGRIFSIGSRSTRLSSHRRCSQIHSDRIFGFDDSSATALSFPLSLLEGLAMRFQGDFDNYDQVVQDRISKMTPGEGGGHEHMHCTLVPLRHLCLNLTLANGDSSLLVDNFELRTVMAAYYLDGDTDRLFRLRLYSMQREGEDAVRMKVFTPGATVFTVMKDMIHRPTEWEQVLSNVAAQTSSQGEDVGNNVFFTELEGCDIIWTTRPDSERHSYLFSSSPYTGALPSSPLSSPEEAYHAFMENGEATIDSTMLPGKQIRVRDELSLWDEELWINDRGFDVGNGKFVYGNRRGIPYKVRRVARFVPQDNFEGSTDNGGDKSNDFSNSKKTNGFKFGKSTILGFQRNVVNQDLVWTLGREWRTEDEYRAKMAKTVADSTASVTREE